MNDWLEWKINMDHQDVFQDDDEDDSTDGGIRFKSLLD